MRQLLGERDRMPAKSPLPASETGGLEALANAYGPALRRYFGKRAYQHADVEDLVQNVLVRLAVRGDSQSIEQPEAYLMRTATNVWRDYLRKKGTHAEAAHEEYVEGQLCEEHGPDTELEGAEAIRSIMVALHELPARTRQVFVLCRVEGLRQKAVARRLGVSVSAVEKHMIRAIAHLAARVRDRRE